MTVLTPRILLGTLAEHTGPGFWILDSQSKIKARPSPARLGFWNLDSGPTDSNPSKSRAEFGWGQNSAPRAEQNCGGPRSCEGEDLSSAHLGSRDDPNETEPPPTPPDSGLWILDFGFCIAFLHSASILHCAGDACKLDQSRPISHQSARRAGQRDFGFWILDSGFWILDSDFSSKAVDMHLQWAFFSLSV